MDQREIDLIKEAIASLAQAQRGIEKAIAHCGYMPERTTMKPNEQQNSALYGPGAQFSDHKIGDRVKFRNERGQVTEDEIVYVIAPNEQQPLTYVMREPNPNTGLPWLLYQSELIEE